MMILLGLTGCGNQNEVTDSDEPKEVTVENGQMETIATNGFTIDILTNTGSAVVSIKNVSAEENQSYKISFTVHLAEENDLISEIEVPQNLDEPLEIDLEIDPKDITGIEYSVEKIESIMKGNPE